MQTWTYLRLVCQRVPTLSKTGYKDLLLVEGQQHGMHFQVTFEISFKAVLRKDQPDSYRLGFFYNYVYCYQQQLFSIIKYSNFGFSNLVSVTYM